MPRMSFAISRYWIALAVCAIGAVASSTASAESDAVDLSISNSAAVADSQQVWLFSTRRIGGNCPRSGVVPTVWQYQCGAGWIASSQDEFLATDDPTTTTVVFVHGNRIDTQEARELGLTTYRRVAYSNCGPNVRFVIWSWPSDPVHGTLVHDAEVKMARTDAEAYYLASALNRISGDVPLSLMGFSFGGRIAAGALHLLGGGTVLGRSIESCSGSPLQERTAPSRAMLIAAAMDCDWLMPGRRYGNAIGQVDRLYVTCNSQDMVLKHYPRVTNRRGVDAIGLTGVAGTASLGEDRAKIDQRSITNIVGHRHGWPTYLDSPGLVAWLRRALFAPWPTSVATVEEETR